MQASAVPKRRRFCDLPTYLVKRRLSVLLVFPKHGRQLKTFIQALSKLNFNSLLASDPEQTIDLCRETQFDIIIIDTRFELILDARELCSCRWINKTEDLKALLSSGFNQDFMETDSADSCYELLLCLEKQVNIMRQLFTAETYFAVVENFPDPVEISNVDHEIQYTNPAYEKLLGYSFEDCAGRFWSEMLASNRNPMEIQLKIKQTLDQSMPWEGTFYVKKKCGEIVGSISRICPVTISGKVTNFFAIRRINEVRTTDSGSLGMPVIVVPSQHPLHEGSSILATSGGSGNPGGRRLSIHTRDRIKSLLPDMNNVPSLFTLSISTISNVLEMLKTLQMSQLPLHASQTIDKVIEMLNHFDREQTTRTTTRRGSVIPKEDDEMVNTLMDGLTTVTTPIVDASKAGQKRRSTVYSANRSLTVSMAHMNQESQSMGVDYQPVAAHSSGSTELIEIKKALENVFTWNFDILRVEELTSRRPLLYVGLKIFQAYKIVDYLGVDLNVFRNWLDVIERNYHSSNPYHNSTHAADVLQATASYCRREKLSNIFDDMDITGALIAAVIHDVDHPGRTNSFLINSGHKLAQLYNDISPLENHHAALAYRLTSRDKSVNIFQNLDREDYKMMRQQIIDMVLATDMTRHFDYVSRFVDLTHKIEQSKEANALPHEFIPEQRSIIKRMLIKCADVSNPVRPIEMCKVWAERIAEEYFRQTDEEKRKGLPVVMPMFDRTKCSIPKAQTSFLNLFINQMMDAWDDFVSIPDILEILDTNLEYWTQQEAIIAAQKLSAELAEST